jgi:hypothetical protein
MNWIKQNPVPAGIMGAGCLGALVATWFAMDASARLGTARETLAAETSRLQILERRQPPPTAQGLESVEKFRIDYEAALSALSAELAAKEEPLEQISPENFQDELRSAANKIAEKAAAKKATLPESFLLGFEEFQAQLPPPEQTPALHREFKVVNRLLHAILDLGIQKIDSLKRGALDKQAAQAEDSNPQPPAKIPQTAEPTIAPPQVHPIQLAFTGEQDDVLKALDLIPAESQFLVIRSLILENTEQEPPSRKSETQEDAADATAEILLPDEADTPKIDIVLGRELVKATVDLELLDFAEPTTPAASSPPSPPAPPTAN